MLDIEDGAILGSSPDDDAASRSVNLVFETNRGDRSWFFTTLQGWMLSDPERGIITPLEEYDNLGFDPPADGETDLQVWLVEPKVPSA